MSCINSFYCTDINHDGFVDIIDGGNQFGFLPQYQRLDANSGEVLMNDRKGNFTRTDPFETGLHLRGEVRDIQKIKLKKENALLFLQNNEYPVLFKMNETGSKK